nr:ABC transporter permease [Rhodococcus sp. 06-621-2]
MSTTKQSRARSRWHRLREMPLVWMVLLTAAIATSFIVPLFVPEERVIQGDLALRGLAPWFASGEHGTGFWSILGTDAQGRDVLLRMIFGLQSSILVGVASIAIGATLGSAVGLLAGYAGRLTDTLLMRFVDIMISMPVILVALVAAATFTQSFWSVSIIIACLVFPRYARQVRGDVLGVKSEDFVQLARINGASHTRVAVVHILPNLMSGIVVMTSLQIGWAILIEASLSFLGAGLPAPAPTLGGMIADGQQHLYDMWWIGVIPGALLAAVVLALNYIGDYIRDRLDPQYSA